MSISTYLNKLAAVRDDFVDVLNDNHIATAANAKLDEIVGAVGTSLAGGGGTYGDTTVREFLSGTYEGVDLTVKFADEIANFSDEWAWIQNRIDTANFFGLLPGDYIPVYMGVYNEDYDGDDKPYNMRIMGIDTYCGNWSYNGSDTDKSDGYNYTFTGKTGTITHHIDFISDVCYGDECQRYGKCIKLPLEDSPTDTTNSMYQVKTTKSRPWPYLNSDIYDFCNTEIYNALPTKVRSKIIPKKLSLERKYKEVDGVQVYCEDPSDMYADIKCLGYLWVPSEYEIFGTSYFSNSPLSHWRHYQYPLFKHCGNKALKMGYYDSDGDKGNTWWWTLTTCSRRFANDFDCYCVRVDGYLNNLCADWDYCDNGFSVPVCFRLGSTN